MSDPNEQGSHHYSEEQSYENDANRLTDKHEAHEAHHRDRERQLEEKYRQQLNSLHEKLRRERHFFEEVITAIRNCFWGKGDLKEDFGAVFEKNIEKVNQDFGGILDDAEHSELNARLEKLGEIAATLSIKIAQSKSDNRKLEQSLVDLTQQMQKESVVLAHKPDLVSVGVSCEAAQLMEEMGEGDADDVFSVEDDKSLQQRHRQLNDSSEFRRMADQREKRLGEVLQRLLDQAKQDLTSDQPIGDGGLQIKLNALVEALKDFYDGDRAPHSPPPVRIDGEEEPKLPSQVSINGSNFDNLTDFLSVFGQLLDLGEPFKGQKIGTGAAGKKKTPGIQLPGLMKGVDEVFKKAKSQTPDQTAASLVADPIFEELLNIFADNVTAELMVGHPQDIQAELATHIQTHLKNILNFNRQFRFGCEKVHDVYLAGLKGCAMVSSYLVELSLEVTQRLVATDALFNPLISKLKLFHEKARVLFEDKHYKVFAKDLRLFLDSESDRQAHFSRLCGDFDEFVSVVRVEAGFLGKEVRSKGH